jgi:GH15 family glucan-1,4-alpha-glucosidase
MRKPATLAPGETVELNLVLGTGIEEFSSSHVVRALTEMIDRGGSQAIIDQAAEWCQRRTRTTGKPDLDLIMNRNFLFTAFYAWGKTFDTEQFVGVTSRSPRYYVSAAYWDRDAMLWSFPALLDIDKSLAKEALEYALTAQLRNTGTHSRFIDGLVLEDGFQLDEAVAPVIALGDYYRQTKDVEFIRAHRQAIDLLRERILGRFDATTGLYSTMQDSQDEYQKLPFSTYSNVLTWRALNDFAEFANLFQDAAETKDLRSRADALKKAIMDHCAATGAPGASGLIFANSTDGKTAQFVDVPPGSLMKLPSLGFIREDEPDFARTYEWLHSKNYQFSYSDQPFGLPGSYRLPITTSWEVADHLRLAKGREQALKVLRASEWDGGIISEGLHPEDATLNAGGGAFATAAGYVAHSICAVFCTDVPR